MGSIMIPVTLVHGIDWTVAMRLCHGNVRVKRIVNFSSFLLASGSAGSSPPHYSGSFMCYLSVSPRGKVTDRRLDCPQSKSRATS